MLGLWGEKRAVQKQPYLGQQLSRKRGKPAVPMVCMLKRTEKTPGARGTRKKKKKEKRVTDGEVQNLVHITGEGLTQ